MQHFDKIDFFANKKLKVTKNSTFWKKITTTILIKKKKEKKLKKNWVQSTFWIVINKNGWDISEVPPNVYDPEWHSSNQPEQFV